MLTLICMYLFKSTISVISSHLIWNGFKCKWKKEKSINKLCWMHFFASERTIKSDKILYYCVENTETVITNSGNEVNWKSDKTRKGNSTGFVWLGKMWNFSSSVSNRNFPSPSHQQKLACFWIMWGSVPAEQKWFNRLHRYAGYELMHSKNQI